MRLTSLELHPQSKAFHKTGEDVLFKEMLSVAGEYVTWSKYINKTEPGKDKLNDASYGSHFGTFSDNK